MASFWEFRKYLFLRMTSFWKFGVYKFLRIDRKWEKSLGECETNLKLSFHQLPFSSLQTFVPATIWVSLYFLNGAAAWNLFWLKCFCVHKHMQIRMRHSNHNFVACAVFDFMLNTSEYLFGKSKEENMGNKNIVFSTAVRRFDMYKSIWKTEGEKLLC